MVAIIGAEVLESGRLPWYRVDSNAIVIAFDEQLRRKEVAQVIVRDLEDVVKKGLKRRAACHGRSMEEEVREILRNAVREGETPPTRLGSRIAARFRGKGLETDLPELRGAEARPATFGE